jgi:hypothetical protein
MKPLWLTLILVNNLVKNRNVLTAILGVFFFALLAVFFICHPAYAQADQMTAVAESAGLSTTDAVVIVARLIRWFLTFLGIIAVVLIMYAGWVYMTSQGEPAKTEKAKTIIRNAIIGLLIILSSYAITSFIVGQLTDSSTSSSGIASVADRYSEPLSGALGAGIIQDHYPNRNATDIARNTKILVTFEEAVNPATLIEGYTDGDLEGSLNAATVQIYPTSSTDVETDALRSDEVSIAIDEEFKVISIDPVELLGSPDEDMNYTVFITPALEKNDGSSAFSGSYADGYLWTFEISTEVDLTPPQVRSVVPDAGDVYARNISIEMTFDEAMDPTVVAGSNAAITVVDASGAEVDGAFEISNGYKTVTFTTTDACSVDPCGDTIYCLPGDDQITVTATAANLGDEPPQALSVGAGYDGVVDVSGNSLDGNADGEASGPEGDSYSWEFDTSNEVNDDIPLIESVDPDIDASNASLQDDVTITFSLPMKASTLNSSSIQMYPNPIYEMWFFVSKDDDATTGNTVASIEHPTFVSDEDGGWEYWPLITHEVKSSYQICMYPAYGPSSVAAGTEERCDTDTGDPYCCDGIRSESPCVTPTIVSGEETIEGYVLPYTE